MVRTDSSCLNDLAVSGRELHRCTDAGAMSFLTCKMGLFMSSKELAPLRHLTQCQTHMLHRKLKTPVSEAEFTPSPPPTARPTARLGKRVDPEQSPGGPVPARAQSVVRGSGPPFRRPRLGPGLTWLWDPSSGAASLRPLLCICQTPPASRLRSEGSFTTTQLFHACHCFRFTFLLFIRIPVVFD